jgi:hypothetical protein
MRVILRITESVKVSVRSLNGFMAGKFSIYTGNSIVFRL